MKLAVISPVYHEQDLLKQFLDHYAPEADAIVLVTHGAADPSLEIAAAYPRVTVWKYSAAEEDDDVGRQEAMLAKKRECAGRFDFVILPDCDEFIVAKAGGSLKATLETHRDRHLFGTDGYQMLAQPHDPPYNPAMPLTQQRKCGVRSSWYCKPIIVRPEFETSYSWGRHRVNGVRQEDIDDPTKAVFYLLHYAFIDEEVCVRRGLMRAARQSARNLAEGHSRHYHGVTERQLRESYRRAVANRAERLPI